MARDHSRSSIVRKNRGRQTAQRKIVVFVEGRNTEYIYIELLKRSYCDVIPDTVRGEGIGSCMEFVEKKNREYDCFSQKKKDKYVQKWLVFDYDGHDDFVDGIKLARSYGFHVAFSSMCIEYWFVLHFYNHDGSPIPPRGDSHSQAQITMLNQKIDLYNRNHTQKIPLYDINTKVISEDFFELMMAIDPSTHRHRVLDAYERARNIHLRKREQGAEFQESVTTVYELLRELGVVVEVGDTTIRLNV